MVQDILAPLKGLSYRRYAQGLKLSPKKLADGVAQLGVVRPQHWQPRQTQYHGLADGSWLPASWHPARSIRLIGLE